MNKSDIKRRIEEEEKKCALRMASGSPCGAVSHLEGASCEYGFHYGAKFGMSLAMELALEYLMGNDWVHSAADLESEWKKLNEGKE